MASQDEGSEVIVENEKLDKVEDHNEIVQNFDFVKAKQYVLDAARAVEDFSASLYEYAQKEGVSQTTKKLYGDVSSKVKEMSSNLKLQLEQNISKEIIHKAVNELKDKFHETVSVLPSKLNDASTKAKEYATTKINDSIEFVQNSPVVNEFGIPIVTALADGIKDQSYQFDQKYHVVGKVGNVVKGIDEALGFKDKTVQINGYFGLTGIINTLVEKSKEIDQYVTGGIGTNIASKGYEVGQKFVDYVVEETNKVSETNKNESDTPEIQKNSDGIPIEGEKDN